MLSKCLECNLTDFTLMFTGTHTDAYLLTVANAFLSEAQLPLQVMNDSVF